MSHHFLIRGLGCVSLAHFTLRSRTSNPACVSHRRAHTQMRTLSATVVLMKSPDEGGVDESLPSKIRGLLSARNAQMPERRTAAF